MSDEVSPVDGLVVAITGAGGGIGAGLAGAFAAAGARVSGCDIGRAADDLTTEVASDVDVTDGKAVGAWIDETVERFGRLDAVIANAGLGRRVTLEEAAWDDIQSVVDVNLFGVLHTFRAALPHMRRAGRGNLVALVSRNAELCPAGLIGYNASKAAVIASVRTLARELAGSGIVVNGLVPGPTLTEMNPAGTREPDSCFPTARLLCTFPGDGPSGRTYFDGEDYPVFSRFSA